VVRGQIRQVQGHRLRGSGQAGEAVAAAPGLKMAPVGAVGAAAVLGLGGFDEAAGLAGEVLEAGDFPARECGDGQIVGQCFRLQRLSGAR
jgi:hypothetical protein